MSSDEPDAPRRTDDFERGFVAMSYVLGRRGSELVEPLSAVSPATAQLVARLGHADRARRAQVLAAELARVAAALELRRLV